MTPQTWKMLIKFFLAAALLNLTYYATYMFYDPPEHTALKLDIKVHAPRTRRFFARRNVTGTVNWSALLLCTKSKDKEYPMNESRSQTPPIIFFLADKEQTTKILKELVMCPLEPTGLGPIPVNKTEVELESVEKLYPEVQQGGMYIPPNCTARHKVAIIVPFRDRLQHLAIFLRHMHPFLMTQQLEYGIFVVEQHSNNSAFNRAKLMNVGFVESQKLKVGGWQCFVFHDVDLLPLDLRNMYSCPRQPRHMSASIDKLGFKLPWEVIFGGVSAMTLEQFTKVNGFSNKYWGWGGEDDDMCHRMENVGFHIARYKMSIARYAMLDHKKSEPNPKRYELLSETRKVEHFEQKEGLSTLEYQIVKVTRNHLYTHILANIDERSW